MDFRLGKFLRDGFTRFPMTAGILVVAVALHVAVLGFQAKNPHHRTGTRDVFGAVSALQTGQNSQLYGPLNFWGDEWWNGEWWRVPISGFHHLDAFHLLMNGLMIGVFGFLLERRMGHWRFLLFFLTATMVSLLPCFLRETYVYGLSGGIYALLGLLMAWRDHNDELAEVVPYGLIVAGVIGLFAGFVLDAAGIIRISNLAHVSGLIYGWFTGRILYKPGNYQHFSRRLFLMGHLLIPVLLFLMTHPFWNGRYHWMLAQNSENTDEQIQHLRQAVRYDPSLSGAWRELSKQYDHMGESEMAWRAMVKSVYFQHTDQKSVTQIRSFWFRIKDVKSRKQGKAIFREIFKDDATVWLNQLQLTNPVAKKKIIATGQRLQKKRPRFEPGFKTNDRRWAIAPNGVDLFWLPVDKFEKSASALYAPTVDPDHPQSALLGRTL
jgi:rhomboid protease GluP